MNPHRILDDHPKAWGYLKVAIIGSILSVAVTLANNERTDQRVNALASKIARQQVKLARDADRKVQDAKDSAAAKRYAATAYAVNFASCGARTLVKPTIATNETLVTALKRVIKDPATNPTALAQDKVRLSKVRKQNAAFAAYLGLYRTIPDDFDCKTLPKKPPK